MSTYMIKKSYIGAGLTSLGLSLLPFVVLAQGGVVPPKAGVPAAVTVTGPQGLVNIFINLVGWFEVIVWALALVMLLYAALQFLTAAGNEEKISSARRSLIYGLIGIAVALIARVAVTFVGGLLQGTG